MGSSVESSFQGYISSTHDALLIFECVRRGILPKVNRRLREEERKLIRSGQVFVFDEKESGIKRWTDGLLWSPSRILYNFLVYRQVEKKTGVTRSAQGSISESEPNETFVGTSAAGQASVLSTAPRDAQDHQQQHPLALGAIAYDDPAIHSAPSTSLPAASDNFSVFPAAGSAVRSSGGDAPMQMPIISPDLQKTESGEANQFSGQSGQPFDGTSTELSAAAWESLSMLEGFGQLPDIAGTSSAPNEANSERHLVGSLTTSYPFAKGGLCKKTISIQIENSTQHLISYYTLEDVRSGRLRSPSSLPEIASLAISPIFLTRTSFRFPPSITYGPDGVPRFAGEEGFDAAQQRRLENDSSGEGTNSSGSERSRRQHHSSTHRQQPQQQQQIPAQHQHFLVQSQSQPQLPRSPSSYTHGRKKSASSRSRALTASGVRLAAVTGSGGMSSADTFADFGSVLSPSASQPLIRAAPLPHQVGGSGALAASRRSSDAALRTTKARYEPYPGNAQTVGATAAMMFASSQQQQQHQQHQQHQQQQPHQHRHSVAMSGDPEGLRSMSMTNSPLSSPSTPFAHQLQVNPTAFGAMTGTGMSTSSSPQLQQPHQMSFQQNAAFQQNPQQSAVLGEASFRPTALGQDVQQPAMLVDQQGGPFPPGAHPINQQAYAFDTSQMTGAQVRPSTHAGFASQEQANVVHASPQSRDSREHLARPQTASTQFGRPLSDQGPLFHASAQENLRRAVATSGWEPLAPSAYQGSTFSSTMGGVPTMHTIQHSDTGGMRTAGSANPALESVPASAQPAGMPSTESAGWDAGPSVQGGQLMPLFDVSANTFAAQGMQNATSFNPQQQQQHTPQWSTSFAGLVGGDASQGGGGHGSQQMYAYQQQQQQQQQAHRIPPGVVAVQHSGHMQAQQSPFTSPTATGFVPSGLPGEALPDWSLGEAGQLGEVPSQAILSKPTQLHQPQGQTHTQHQLGSSRNDAEDPSGRGMEQVFLSKMR